MKLTEYRLADLTKRFSLVQNKKRNQVSKVYTFINKCYIQVTKCMQQSNGKRFMVLSSISILHMKWIHERRLFAYPTRICCFFSLHKSLTSVWKFTVIKSYFQSCKVDRRIHIHLCILTLNLLYVLGTRWPGIYWQLNGLCRIALHLPKD